MDDSARQRLAAMAEAVAGHNNKVSPDWRTKGWEFYRAVWTECAELLDHIGWKWWKHQPANTVQAQLEVTDIWIFGLSDLLARGNTVSDLQSQGVIETLSMSAAPDCSVEALRREVEALAGAVLRTHAFQVGAFGNLMRAMPMSFEELFKLTMGKTVLNHFRQDCGYRTGTYEKIWNGLEDNAQLIQAIHGDHGDDAGFATRLYAELSTRYQDATEVSLHEAPTAPAVEAP